MRNALLLLVAATALAGCRPWGDRQDAAESGAVAAGGDGGGRVGDPVKRGAEKATPETLPRNLAVADANQTNEVAPPASDLVIPPPFRGRWGLVPADCEQDRSDAKGLLTIGERTLRFYESAGTLRERQAAAAPSFAGVFAFTGEGMNWERTITLTRDGNQLRRVEDGGEEGPVDLTYTACPAS